MKPTVHGVLAAVCAVCLVWCSCTDIDDSRSSSIVSYEPINMANKPWLSGRDLFFTYCHGDTFPSYIDSVSGDTVAQRIVRADTLVLSGQRCCAAWLDDSLVRADTQPCFLRIAALPKGPGLASGAEYDTLYPLEYRFDTTDDFTNDTCVVHLLERAPDGIYLRGWTGGGGLARDGDELVMPLNAQAKFSTGEHWASAPMLAAPWRLEAAAHDWLDLLPGAAVVEYAGDTSMIDQTFKLFELTQAWSALGTGPAGEQITEQLVARHRRPLELSPGTVRFAERVYYLSIVHTVVRLHADGARVVSRESITVAKTR